MVSFDVVNVVNVNDTSMLVEQILLHLKDTMINDSWQQWTKLNMDQLTQLCVKTVFHNFYLHCFSATLNSMSHLADMLYQG